jgi:glycosyltransferase involved in cell wall biosynthesis
MAAGLARAGVEITIATTDDNGVGHLDVPLELPVSQDGVTIWYFHRQTRFYSVSWPLTYWLARHVHDYDLLHIHALFSYASLPAAFFAAARKKPYIIRPLGTLTTWAIRQRRPKLKRLSFSLIERRILTRAAAIHYTSEQELEEARPLNIPTPGLVLPLGIDVSTFNNLPHPDIFFDIYPELRGRDIILFMSRLDPKKGLDILLPAFSTLYRRNKNLALVIAGNGDEHYLSYLRSMIHQLGIDEGVVFTGFLGGSSKLAALSAASLFVLPSYSENFGIAVAEALAAGLPIVISDQVGISPEVRNAEAGLVTSCDPESLTSGIESLLGNPHLRGVMSTNAKRLAQQRFASDIATHRLAKLYQDVVRGGQLDTVGSSY